MVRMEGEGDDRRAVKKARKDASLLEKTSDIRRSLKKHRTLAKKKIF